MLTPKGAVESAVTLFLLFAGVLGGGTLVFLLGVGLLAILLVGRLRVQAGRVDATREQRSGDLVEDEDVETRITLRNRSRLRALIEYRDTLTTSCRVDGPYEGDLMLAGRATGTASYRIRFPLRGHHTVGPVRIRMTDPFYNYATERHLGTTHEVRVYPRAPDLDDFPASSRHSSWLAGLHVVNSPGHSMDFFALRDYQSSDRMRDINWKASARRPRGSIPVVNQRTRESYAEVVVVLDARRPMLVGWETYDPLAQGARAVLAMMRWVHQRRDALRVLLVQDMVHEVRPGNPDRQAAEVLGALRRLEAKGTAPLPVLLEAPFMRLRPNSPVVIITSLEGGEGVADVVSGLRARDHYVAVVVPVPCFDADGDEPTGASLSPAAESEIERLRAHGAHVIRWVPGTPLPIAVEQEVVA